MVSNDKYCGLGINVYRYRLGMVLYTCCKIDSWAIFLSSVLWMHPFPQSFPKRQDVQPAGVYYTR